MKVENNNNNNKNKNKKEKSTFTLAEELRQKLQKQQQDRDNALTSTKGSSSWVARRLLDNASFGKTGNLEQ
jgi:GH18 family chitinase